MNKPRILFVDDELDMRIFLSAVLRTGGFDAVPARNAVEAIRAAREHPPDLVVMDVMMPESGGVSLYQELKADPLLAGLPVIVLTGVKETAFAHHLKMINLRREEALPPPDAYLEKPLVPETLLALIRGLLPRTP